MKPLDVQAAEWLIFGFNKCWSMEMLSIQLSKLEGGHFGFMPTNRYWYGQCPVRGFVAQNYPKLNEFLTSATTEKQIKAAGQIVKLSPKVDRPAGGLTSTERNEIARSRKDLRGATTSYRLSRDIFKDHSGTDWNTCS